MWVSFQGNAWTVFEHPALAAELAALYERDLSTSRRIGEAEAATFEKPASVRRRVTKELASLLEDQM